MQVVHRAILHIWYTPRTSVSTRLVSFPRTQVPDSSKNHGTVHRTCYTCVTLERASKDRDQLYSSWMSVLSRSVRSLTSAAATALVSTEWR